VALFYRPDVTKIDIATEQAQISRSTAGAPGPERS
jgi:hypothetical protein